MNTLARHLEAHHRIEEQKVVAAAAKDTMLEAIGRGLDSVSCRHDIERESLFDRGWTRGREVTTIELVSGDTIITIRSGGR